MRKMTKKQTPKPKRSAPVKPAVKRPIAKKKTTVRTKKKSVPDNTLNEQILDLQARLIDMTTRCEETEQQLAVERARRAFEDKQNTQLLLDKEAYIAEKENAFEISLDKEITLRMEAQNALLEAEAKNQALCADLSAIREVLEETQKECARLTGDLSEAEGRLNAGEKAHSALESLGHELSQYKWYLGEEKAARARLDERVSAADDSLNALQGEVTCLKADIAEKEKQADELQWYLGEARQAIVGLEARVSEAHCQLEQRDAYIAELQTSLSEANQLAAKWMSRWDTLIEETIKDGGDLCEDDISSGTIIDKTIAKMRSQIETYKEQQKELEDRLLSIQKDRDDLLCVNVHLQDELSDHKEKYDQLQSKYDEANWYLGEARHKLDQLQIS